MLLVITPVSDWHRQIKVYSFMDGDEAQWFQAFQKVNELYEADGIRDTVNIQLVPITIDQLSAWLDNNVDPTWWERLWGRYRIELTKLRRAT